ncbi:MAG: PBECR2 nuclease fold domain-containing protein, partial [Bacteroides sp.]
LTADKWGIESVPKQMEKAMQPIPTQEKTASTIWKRTSNEGVISLPDYRGRIIVLEKKQFDSHTTGKGSDNRIVYWDAMCETLLNPDEVWLNDDIKKNVYDTYSLIRYYQDGVIVANYRIEEDKLVLKTWYLMRTSKDPNKRIDLKKIWDKRRHGLLIKKAEK